MQLPKIEAHGAAQTCRVTGFAWPGRDPLIRVAPAMHRSEGICTSSGVAIWKGNLRTGPGAIGWDAKDLRQSNEAQKLSKTSASKRAASLHPPPIAQPYCATTTKWVLEENGSSRGVAGIQPRKN